MSVMDIFKNFVNNGGQQQTPAQQTQQAAAQNPTVPSDATQKSDGTGPAAIPKAGEGEQSPLAEFTKLWEKSDKDPQPASLVPQMNVDPKQIMAAAQKVDFTKILDPELLKKAGEGDTSALAAIVNQTAQAAFAQSANATTKIVEAALKQQETALRTQVMPEILRQHSVSQTLRQDNPLFDNPAVAPLVSMVEQQLAIKFPNASPAEIKQHAQNYFGGMTEEIAKSLGKSVIDTPAQQQGSAKKGETDWGKFFGE